MSFESDIYFFLKNRKLFSRIISKKALNFFFFLISKTSIVLLRDAKIMTQNV